MVSPFVTDMTATFGFFPPEWLDLLGVSGWSKAIPMGDVMDYLHELKRFHSQIDRLFLHRDLAGACTIRKIVRKPNISTKASKYKILLYQNETTIS